MKFLMNLKYTSTEKMRVSASVNAGKEKNRGWVGVSGPNIATLNCGRADE